MLQLDFKNVLRDRIGYRHGIREGQLKKYCAQYESEIHKIFKSKHKAGYAFSALPDDENLVRKIKRFTKAQQGKWSAVVVLGIGGSALGLIAIQEALIGPFSQKPPQLFVVDNIDPDYMTGLAGHLDLKRTLFVVISKSGGTVEPMTLYSFFRQQLVDKKVKNLSDHFVFITDVKSGLLRKMGLEEGIPLFEVPAKVGGRFSVLSSVGLLPAALAGVDISGLMKGAKAMRKRIKNKKGVDNPALALAAIQYLLDIKKKKTMTVMMPYSHYLFRCGDWYRQLLAESIGKNPKTGPTPLNALGTTDQHSQLQLYHDGPHNKWFIFLNVLRHANQPVLSDGLPDEMSFLNGKKVAQIINAAYHGTAEALAENKRPNVTLTLDQINAESIGALFMLFEFQVVILGAMYRVNAFDQPGVEASKKLTKLMLNSKP